jgi:hypothetical protein
MRCEHFTDIEPEYIRLRDLMIDVMLADRELKCAFNSSCDEGRIRQSWFRIKKRCHNPKSTSYPSYGAKGINVCQYWRYDFKAFYDWAISHGYRCDRTIDRIHNDIGYCPNNCRWVSAEENQRYRGPISRPEIGY